MQKYIIHGNLKTDPGAPYLFGANLVHDGCNFAIFSKNGTSVSLLFFDNPNDIKPSNSIILDEKVNKTGDVWHIFIYGIKEGQCYGYIIDGPYWPDRDGHRFNKHKLLLDPYAKAISGNYNWNVNAAYAYQVGSGLGDLSFNEESNFGCTAKSVVINSNNFDWDGDKQLNIPLKNTIIYEIHTRAFTMDKSSGVKNPGTYAGLIEKIPYLTELGITTIELMPVHHFNHLENVRNNPITNEKLYNFWGYSSLGFFAPDAWYASDNDGVTAVYEFKKMVKAMHEAGIEVILDVVYNHTGEGNEYGPTVSFKGIDNSIYYMTEQGRHYKNFSGCGNTLNCNHQVVKKLIKDSLRYWVIDMHIDGFRFDLAAILGRDKHGNWQPDYSVLDEINNDPILGSTQIIAEGWDAAGLYKLGGFPSGWAEWNAKFRDDIRGFIKGDTALSGEVAKRIAGSADLFYYGDRKPCHSINFLTAHDGFTLYDLVSYNNKNNIENGEGNADGNNHNLSWNCGAEGLTDNQTVLSLRDRNMKSMMGILLLSQGTPMILGGDEIKYSKSGNNNTYCHDNRLNWIDWTLLDKNNNFFEFSKYLINFRKKHPVLRREGFLKGVDSSGNEIRDISWHGIQVQEPDWGIDSHTIAFMLDGSKGETGAELDDNNIYVIINAYWEDLVFHLPSPGKEKTWYVAVDSSTEKGFYEVNKEQKVKSSVFNVRSRSLVVLIDKKP